MKKIFFLSIVIFMFIAIGENIKAQKVVHPTKTSRAVYHDTYGPLIKINKNRKFLTKQEVIERNETFERNETLKERSYPFASTALPKGADPVWQKTFNVNKSINSTAQIIQNFAGKTSPYDPPDCNGAVGPNYFFQTINTEYAIYDKNGNFVTGNNMNTLFSGVTGSNNNDGDPIILYDEQAGRWLAAEFSISSSPYYMLIAVSQTGDPTGTWDRWSFQMNGFPDYMKFGIWEDGYYMATNTSSGDDIYVFERSVMLSGGASPQMIQFDNPNRPNTSFHCIMPFDCDWSYAPSGTPGGFITINDDAWGGTGDQLWIFECSVDWNNTANSTFSRTQTINVASFDSNFGSSMDNITQKGTSQKLDGIPQVLMYRAQYVNFGNGDERIVCNHTVDVDGSNHAGVRWYELQKSGGNWSIRQQGTYAPDADNRWMAGISENQHHEIGLAYSVSSSNTYPSIRCTGQSATENANASGNMDITEAVLQAGTSSQTSSNRWGDYAGMSVDPNDSITFWFTSEYNANKTTKISAFRFQDTGDPFNLSANGVSSDQVDVTWNLNTTGDNTLIAYNTTNTFGTPANGTTYSAGQTIPGGGTVLYYGPNTTYNHTGLDCGSTYYYKAWSYLSNNTYSPGITTTGSTSSDVILTEDFESASGTTPPSGWTTSSNGAGWSFGTNLGSQYFPISAHTTYACSNDDQAGNGNDASVDFLVSPVLDLSNYTNTSLQFVYTYSNTYGSVATVEVSTNGGSSWTVVSTLNPADWGTANVDLSAYDGQSNIKVAFHHDDQGQWADGFAVDDVVFSGCPTGGCSSPSITSQPSNIAECLGNSVTFSTTAGGTAPLSYQWQKGGNNISGATNSTYTISNITNGDAGNYTCYVSNACGNITTNVATLTINPATSITTQPVSLNANSGDNVQFTVSATGSNLTYQWKKDGANINNGGNISGATTSSLTITSVTTSDQGDYTCQVSGDCGTLTSNAATLSVIVSVNDIKTYGLQINPNPSTGKFTITSNNNTLNNIKIFNDLGQIVFAKNINSNICNVDLSKQNKGVYFIEINNNGKLLKSKIIIK